MKNGQLCWFEIPVKNASRAQSFYERILGWKFQKAGSNDYWFIFSGEEMCGGLSLEVEGQSEKLGVAAYFSVASIEKALELVAASGGRVLQNKTKISDDHGYFSKIVDSEGNGIHLWSAK